jgi:hypothetical protein
MKPGTHDPESCWTCDNAHCDLHVKNPQPLTEPQVFMLDDYSPEFDAYIAARVRKEDILCIPLDGKRWNKPNYGWTVSGGMLETRSHLALLRSLRMRYLASEGAGVRQMVERMAEMLYRSYRKSLPYTCQRIVLDQSFLPYAYRLGDLGGPKYDVLMKRYPFCTLHEKLDSAKRLHPESRTLADFRIDEGLVESEWAALEGARKLITPNADIARLFPTKTTLLPWQLPQGRARSSGRHIAFLGPTLGRKGCYEVRALARELGLKLVVFGMNFEGDDFWNGVQTEQRVYSAEALADIGVLLAPAFAGGKVKPLLEAHARGIRIFANATIGLPSSMYEDFSGAGAALKSVTTPLSSS